MTIEQTKGFKSDVLCLVRYAEETRYLTGRGEKLAYHLNRLAGWRGSVWAVKCAKKANQVLHEKAYHHEFVKDCKGRI